MKISMKSAVDFSLGVKFILVRGGAFMQIIPMRDLKNTVEVERRCAEENV